MLTFDRIDHEYRWDGKVVPSVTQVIGEWQQINVYGVEYYANTFTGAVVKVETFRAAADFGTAVHSMCHMELKGILSESALHPALIPPLEQFRTWMDHFKPEILLVEQPMYSQKYGYAGTPDIICMVKNKPLVCDIKTGEYAMAGVQIAGYEQLYKENSRKWGRMGRYVLYIPKNGGAYRFHPVGSPRDWAFFQARLFQWQYLTR